MTHFNIFVAVKATNIIMTIITNLNEIAKKVGDPNPGSKCYLSLLKIQLNGKEIPYHPLLSSISW